MHRNTWRLVPGDRQFPAVRTAGRASGHDRRGSRSGHTTPQLLAEVYGTTANVTVHPRNGTHPR
ncbi:hypothetical protein [Streptomyces sp. NPDC017086]|uniref:hypothetical protein n=1 Tax=Streptomyces sp. NPDC017086 TaxID=3364976 RepID=UPI0037B01B10